MQSEVIGYVDLNLFCEYGTLLSMPKILWWLVLLVPWWLCQVFATLLLLCGVLF
jgi:hypothetical protein